MLWNFLWIDLLWIESRNNYFVKAIYFGSVLHFYRKIYWITTLYCPHVFAGLRALQGEEQWSAGLRRRRGRRLRGYWKWRCGAFGNGQRVGRRWARLEGGRQIPAPPNPFRHLLGSPFPASLGHKSSCNTDSSFMRSTPVVQRHRIEIASSWSIQIISSSRW